MHLGDGYLTRELAQQLRTHRTALVVGTACTLVYTAIVWWICQPLVKQFTDMHRRPARWIHSRR